MKVVRDAHEGKKSLAALNVAQQRFAKSASDISNLSALTRLS